MAKDSRKCKSLLNRLSELSFPNDFMLRAYPKKPPIEYEICGKVGGNSMNKYTGSSFDNFLEDEGILKEVSARAKKRLLTLQINDIMETTNLSKICLAEKINTDITQLDRLLDPGNTSIILLWNHWIGLPMPWENDSESSSPNLPQLKFNR
jgi:antitoxin HicB